MTNTQSYAEKTGSNSGGLAIEATLLPPGADPRQRDGGSDTFRTWSVRRGEFSRARSVRRPGGAQGRLRRLVIGEAGLWNGERMGSTLALALETLRDSHPGACAACARRFANSLDSCPAFSPGAAIAGQVCAAAAPKPRPAGT